MAIIPAAKILFKGGKKLIKLYRGETIAKNKIGPGRVQTKEMKKYQGRWFSPDKNEAKYFSNSKDKSQKGNRILKTVTVTKKDYNIGNKLYKKVFGPNHCRGDHCILPTKNIKNVKSRTFKTGGLNDYYKGML